MKNIAYGSKRHRLQFMRVCGLILITYTSMILPVTSSYAAVKYVPQARHAICPTPAAPTPQSLLVVMLDRSGSLIVQPGATDPDRYSTSVTKALTVLWPGSMIVIPFRNNQALVDGPFILSDPTQRETLQQKIDAYPIGNNTPLGQAMHKAFDTLNGAPAGSRGMIITDGQPNTDDDPGGAKQSKDIRDNLIARFCSLGIPITPFGLTINQNDPAGRNANQLLTDIATGTGTTYTDVTGAKDLARAVISLYAQWQDLTFTQEDNQGGNFPVTIDTFAKQVQIVTFRSSEADQVTLDGPDGQSVQGIPTSTDKHYVIYTPTPGVFVAGNYIVHTGNDADAQVYALVNSPLQIKITAPTVKQLFYGNPITIQASFFNGTSVLTPTQGQSQLVAHVIFLIHGQAVGAGNDIVLTQQGTVFTDQTEVYTLPGELDIQVTGSYQGVQRQSSISVQLVAPPPPPPPPCRSGLLACTWQQYHTLILIFVPLLLLLGLLLFYLSRSAPFGILEHGSDAMILGKARSLRRRLFSKSRISSSELTAFDLNGAAFSLHFKGRDVYLKPTDNVPAIVIKDDNGETHPAKRGNLTRLSDEAAIIVDGTNIATFKTSSSHDQDQSVFQREDIYGY